MSIKNLSKTKVTTHNLSPITPPTHKPTNRLTDTFTENKALDFVFGFNFAEAIETTGKKEHDDFQKLFAAKEPVKKVTEEKKAVKKASLKPNKSTKKK